MPQSVKIHINRETGEVYMLAVRAKLLAQLQLNVIFFDGCKATALEDGATGRFAAKAGFADSDYVLSASTWAKTGNVYTFSVPVIDPAMLSLFTEQDSIPFKAEVEWMEVGLIHKSDTFVLLVSNAVIKE